MREDDAGGADVPTADDTYGAPPLPPPVASAVAGVLMPIDVLDAFVVAEEASCVSEALSFETESVGPVTIAEALAVPAVAGAEVIAREVAKGEVVAGEVSTAVVAAGEVRPVLVAAVAGAAVATPVPNSRLLSAPSVPPVAVEITMVFVATTVCVLVGTLRVSVVSSAGSEEVIALELALSAVSVCTSSETVRYGV